jgi:hypothetical protein
MTGFLVENRSVLQRARALLWVELSTREVATLRFGTVQISVHGSRVVQNRKTENVRVFHPFRAHWANRTKT